MIDASKLCQIEIHSMDIEVSRLFYDQVFGWKLSPAELHQYYILDVPPDCPFGISLVPVKSLTRSTSHIVLYFQVTDAQAIAHKAVAHGGTKNFGPTKLPAYGSIWQITDPDGHRFGLFEKAERHNP